ncbi:hypothetical protein HUJ04_009999 [Dendroctonus ponderosae]|nr:hypothetical protein HUJ04_009999 [Dendroctonus ponderosae]
MAMDAISANICITFIYSITRQLIMKNSTGFRTLIKHIIDTENSVSTIQDSEIDKIRENAVKESKRKSKWYLYILCVVTLQYILRPAMVDSKMIKVGNMTKIIKPLPLSSWFPFDEQEFYKVAYVWQVLDSLNQITWVMFVFVSTFFVSMVFRLILYYYHANDVMYLASSEVGPFFCRAEQLLYVPDKYNGYTYEYNGIDLSHASVGGGYLKRANPVQLQDIFNKYASIEKNGEKFMTPDDFVIRFLGLLNDKDFNADTVRLLAGIVDTSKDGLISYPEFQAFEGLLCFPDALYKTAFQLFDTNGNGMVSFQEFVEVMKKTELHQRIPFNMDTPFVQLYFGKNKQRLVTYNEFSQFLHDFHEEYAIEGFRRADKDGSGFISVLDFQDIMINIKSHLLTKEVQTHLIEAVQGETQSRRVSFPYFIAFNSLLNNMELVKRIYLNVTNGHRAQEVSKYEFMHSAQAMSQMTPLEVEILFHLVDVLHQTGRIVYNDLYAIAPEQYFKQITNRLAEIHAVSSPEERGVLIQILESAYRFTLGSIAGAVGATAVYPIDLVNDLVRDKLTDKNGNIPLYGEILSGACAGGSQVIFTNPLEIVKIRLQVAGEIAGGAKVRAWNVVKELGLFGLYKGARACLLRDVPFSAIYFPAYAHTKASFADESGYNHPLTLLVAGAIAGIPAASLVTPADVIKTRLQVVARAGQTTYTGVLDATRKIYAEEGFRAFWKGSIARVFRSSPQFGVTLLTYELLQRTLYVDFGGSRPSGSELKVPSMVADNALRNADHLGGYSVSGGGYLKRANPVQLQDIFNKYASIEKNGEKFMTPDDFVIRFLGLLNDKDFNADTVRLLAGIVDTSKDGLISYPEFQAFEGLLCFPDALYKTAFQLFDTNGNGMVSFQEFVEVMKKTELHQRIPFNMDTPFVQLYFGKNKQRLVTYNEFSQFLHDFHEEYAIEGFRRADKDGSGFISVLDFQDIMINIKSHLLTKEVQTHLIEAVQGETQSRRVSFPYFIAFNSLLNNMELVKRIYLNVTNGHRAQEVSKYEFMHSAQAMSQMTPLEVEILFHLVDVLHQTGRIVYNDLYAIAPEQYFKQITNRLAEIHAVSSPEERGVLIQILESAYRFTLGSIAGAVGATAVYPIDLVNDLVRDKLTDKNGNIPLYGEILSGACAGGSQVIFTNPLEIVKIRLQVAGEIAGGAKVRAWNVVKELGLFGLYKGARACLLRDVPFSAIYFPAYAHTKASFADESGYNHPLTLLVAGAIAGIPAASLVTPADVIKTRLQVVARAGQTTYSGVLDATRKIYAEEGFRAFWKGSIARVFRSSPQFGVTLLTYELLQRTLYVDFGGSRPSGSELKVPSIVADNALRNADHLGGYSVSVPIFSGIETKFGLCLPKFSLSKAS